MEFVMMIIARATLNKITHITDPHTPKPAQPLAHLIIFNFSFSRFLYFKKQKKTKIAFNSITYNTKNTKQNAIAYGNKVYREYNSFGNETKQNHRNSNTAHE